MATTSGPLGGHTEGTGVTPGHKYPWIRVGAGAVRQHASSHRHWRLRKVQSWQPTNCRRLYCTATSSNTSTKAVAPVVVLIHGLLGAHSNWEPQIETLSRHYRVIAPDLFGHGASDKPAGD